MSEFFTAISVHLNPVSLEITIYIAILHQIKRIYKCAILVIILFQTILVKFEEIADLVHPIQHVDLPAPLPTT